MNKTRIVAVTKALPTYSRDTKDILPFVEVWMKEQDTRFQRKVLKIFEGAAVDKRYSIMSPEEVFGATSFEEKNNVYIREVKKLGRTVLEQALLKSGWSPDSLDFIITVSCTGIMIPSLDAYLINDLDLRRDIVRLPVTEMGCAAGVSGLIYARNFLRSNPGKRAAIVAVESPTATFQLNDYSMANVVSAAIFGDGAACVLVSSEKEATGPRIIHPFLKRNGSSIEKVDHLIFHPGGKKIVETVENLFGEMGKDLGDTRETLRLYGNMSSATVLYVLERFMEKEIPKGEQGLLLSFGPGFSAQRILLEW